MVPNPIKKAIVKQVIMAFVEVAPVALPEGMFNQLVSGEQDLDAFNEEFINEINDRICIPIISKDVQNFIVQNVCTVLFSSASTKKFRRQMAVRAMRDSLNANSSVEFATKLNDMIDIPLSLMRKSKRWRNILLTRLLIYLINLCLKKSGRCSRLLACQSSGR